MHDCYRGPLENSHFELTASIKACDKILLEIINRKVNCREDISTIRLMLLKTNKPKIKTRTPPPRYAGTHQLTSTQNVAQNNEWENSPPLV